MSDFSVDVGVGDDVTNFNQLRISDHDQVTEEKIDRKTGKAL